MTLKLTGVPETMLIPLWARAEETKRKDAIIRDDRAVEIIGKIDYDFKKFENAWKSQTGVAIRTSILDTQVKKFIGQYPKGIVINLGCGLDTRFARLDNGRISWIDLDLPEVIDIRLRFFPRDNSPGNDESMPARYTMVAASVLDIDWTKSVRPGNEKVLIVAEGLLMYFERQEIHSLMKHLVQSFPGAGMLFEMMTPTIVKLSGKHDTVTHTGAVFKWGITSGKEMEAFHENITFVSEYNFFDFHQKRWKWMRWPALIPAFKNRMNNRIVHLEFEDLEGKR